MDNKVSAGSEKDRKKKIIPKILIFLVLISAFFIHSKELIYLLVAHDQENLTAMANAIMESGVESPEHPWYFRDIDYYDSIQMVEFTTSDWGIVPSGVRKGFYYSPQNIPLGYHYGEVSFLPYEEGWLWEEENGNNTIYTEKIVDHWFWFEFRW